VALRTSPHDGQLRHRDHELLSSRRRCQDGLEEAKRDGFFAMRRWNVDDGATNITDFDFGERQKSFEEEFFGGRKLLQVFNFVRAK
jgi:hypothetical protein